MLATNYFTHLAGDTAFDAEMVTRLEAGEDLIRLQMEFHGRGRDEAEIVKTLNGWSIRHVSGLHNRGLIVKGCTSYEEAKSAGIAWVSQAPAVRSLIVRNSDIPKVG